MINFINVSYDEYLRKYSKSKIICIGAGGTFYDFLEVHQDKIELLNKVEYVLDNNEQMEGMFVQILKKKIGVNYLPKFNLPISKKWVVFLLVKDEYLMDLISQLDKLAVFDEIDCIYGLGSFKWGYSFFPTPKYKINNVKRIGDEIVPKKIHYCWFGEDDIPIKDLRCIDSFSRYNPTYEIIKWSEDNFDILKAPQYVREAYRNKKYAFVSDYVRLYVLYHYGGIYLDTDVELFTDLDFILKYRMMFAYMEYGEIATGLGFASVPKAIELKEMMELYEQIPFEMENGKLYLTPCPRYTNDYFRRKGLSINNSTEIWNGILFLSSDYLCPISPIECSDGSYQLAQLCLSDRTIGIHWCNNTWKSKDELMIFELAKKEREDINNRLLLDWKRTRGII